MANNTEQAGAFHPLHKGHAIEHVVCLVQFDREIAEDAVSELRKAGKALETDLPGIHQLQSMQLMIATGASLSASPPVSGAPVGYLFQRIHEKGSVESEVKADRNSLLFRSQHYTRWKDIWGRASKFFETLLPVYMGQGAQVQAVSLNFSDKFVWHGRPETSDASKLLRPGSKYVASCVLEAKDLWHSHTGAFVRVDAHVKRLVNVNIDCVDQQIEEEARRVVSIVSALVDQFNQPGYERTETGGARAMALIGSSMRALHEQDKDVLGNIINDEMVQRIALKAENA